MKRNRSYLFASDHQGSPVSFVIPEIIKIFELSLSLLEVFVVVYLFLVLVHVDSFHTYFCSCKPNRSHRTAFHLLLATLTFFVKSDLVDIKTAVAQLDPSHFVLICFACLVGTSAFEVHSVTYSQVLILWIIFT